MIPVVIQYLFNNAGVYFADNTVDCSEEEWDLTIDINLKGTFLMSKFVLPSMIKQGSGVIINNGSGWGIVGGNEAVSYCASKGGVVLLTKAMAIDHAAQGIRVNCLCPGDTHIKYGYLVDDDYYVIKIASGFFESPSSSRYTSDGLILLFKKRTGELACALLDKCHITQSREIHMIFDRLDIR